MSEVTITVSGRVGCGKSAICGEIEILCKALCLSVEWIGGQEEKNLTHADWTDALEMHKPNVRIIEKIERKDAAPIAALTTDAGAVLPPDVRALLTECAGRHGQMVNGDRLSSEAKTLLSIYPERQS